ncbi:MAG TPA: histidine kinase, partial [Solirubrobacteraceae bacterium]
AAVALPLGVMLLGPDEVPVASLISIGSLFAGASIGGWLVRGRLAAAAASRAEIAALEARRREVEARAAAEARARLARDIHDACGHAVVLVALQAETARALTKTDTARAGAAIGVARDGLEAALGELERLAAVTPGRRLPGLAELAPLVDRLRDADVDAQLALDVSGPVDAALGHAVYRLAQEALTNAAKHAAGGAVAVTVRTRAERLEVSVRNGPGRSLAVAPGGHGLRAMRERVAALGGAVRAGKDASGGWTVTGTFPLRPPGGTTHRVRAGSPSVASAGSARR